jgi:hypothetical protein
MCMAKRTWRHRRAWTPRTEFQQIVDHRGLVGNGFTGALAHLGLGRAYALAGDTAKAKTAYQTFLTLWQNADPTSPVLSKPRWNTRGCSSSACNLARHRVGCD